ncbi:hypothetical protein [Indioceanicola profundi]|uniref:hypothetical protein n=1 Tax=Indioceanicola profundi TaxID=2220096 RepID=UPI0013C472DA|nr:hypothetical protein [Indioceanicola profundi]
MLSWLGVVVFGAGVAGVSSPQPDIHQSIQSILPESIRKLIPTVADPIRDRLACERAVELLFKADSRSERAEAAAIVDHLDCHLAEHVAQMGNANSR